MFSVVSGLPILAFNYPKQHLKAMLSGFLFYINNSQNTLLLQQQLTRRIFWQPVKVKLCSRIDVQDFQHHELPTFGKSSLSNMSDDIYVLIA